MKSTMPFFDLLQQKYAFEETYFGLFGQVKPKILYWKSFLDNAVQGKLATLESIWSRGGSVNMSPSKPYVK